jgi:hypothetical protein
MNIIFGDAVKEIPDSFTVLELDTFRTLENHNTTTVYCVVEKIPTTELAALDAYKKIHADVIKYYKKREFHYCETALNALMGRWSGELDTFYSDLLQRVIYLKQNPPLNDWDGIRVQKT